MPLTPSTPTWLAWNNANFTSPTGLSDAYNGQPIAAGGLNLGAYFDATNDEAANASYGVNGRLYAGRYRMVQVDSGATAANVKTGTIGYIRLGGASGSVKAAIITAVGSGQTVGTYTINAALGSGGGSGAVLQVVVGSAGTITSVAVLNGGFNYSSAPTFPLTVIGGTGGAVAAQLDETPNIVTSTDQVGVTGIAVRPVVYLNAITPGNYGFIQELGTATVLNPASTTQTAGNFAIPNTTTGVMAASVTTITPLVLGLVIDTVVNTAPANTPFKIQLGYACTVVQD